MHFIMSISNYHSTHVIKGAWIVSLLYLLIGRRRNVKVYFVFVIRFGYSVVKKSLKKFQESLFSTALRFSLAGKFRPADFAI